MKRLLALALPMLALAGCEIHSDACHYDSHGVYHCYESHHNQTVYYPEGNGGGSNNIIIVEEETAYYCDDTMPYYHDPEYCTFGSESCCTWMGSEYGWEETWCFDDCEWYMESYQLVEYYF